jgi:membrane fusion protein (multidrug efflux system)
VNSSTPSLEPARRGVPFVIGALALGVLLAGAALVRRADSKQNDVALSASPKLVTVVPAAATTYRDRRRYVGTLEPWVEAKIGPQLVSAYVDTVLVRPGAAVKKGDVLATLDCRGASAQNQIVAMQARAIDAQQRAMANEAARVQGLAGSGFASANEAEQKLAQSQSQEAQLLALRAKMASASLEVGDCALRAPFDGEVATRTGDPGSFLRPGNTLLTIVDRRTIRVVADAPESDFAAVAPGNNVEIHVLATGATFTAAISRRTPQADASTRTVHFELDVADPNRAIPVGTTAELALEVGEAKPALAIPLVAAKIKGSVANAFVVDGTVAHAAELAVLGEREGTLFVEPTVAAGALVVTNGRNRLADKDVVATKVEKRL